MERSAESCAQTKFLLSVACDMLTIVKSYFSHRERWRPPPDHDDYIRVPETAVIGLWYELLRSQALFGVVAGLIEHSWLAHIPSE